MNDGDYTTMRDIGKQFDASSHEIGRWLTELGLRTKFKEPSQEAITGGFCKRRAVDGVPGGQVVWNVAKTVAALEKAGHQQIVKPPAMPMSAGDSACWTVHVGTECHERLFGSGRRRNNLDLDLWRQSRQKSYPVDPGGGPARVFRLRACVSGRSQRS